MSELRNVGSNNDPWYADLNDHISITQAGEWAAALQLGWVILLILITVLVNFISYLIVGDEDIASTIMFATVPVTIALMLIFRYTLRNFLIKLGRIVLWIFIGIVVLAALAVFYMLLFG